jgi:ribosomal-protein-alanine N-acetyltransferase
MTGRQIGFISASRIDASHAKIMMFAVDPDHRSRGAGTRLLSAFRQRIAVQGMRDMTLEVRVSNNAVISFYRKRGFVPCGILERFYTDGGDALRMVSQAQLNI